MPARSLGHLLVLTLASSQLATALPADELRLADGRVLVGVVATKGDRLEITTRDGVVTVDASAVVARRTDRELRAELARLAADRKDDAFTHLQLAETALGFGLEREMWRHLDRGHATLADTAPDAAIRRRFAQFLRTLEPEIVPAHVRDAKRAVKLRAVVRYSRVKHGPAHRAATLAWLCAEPGADDDLQLLSKTAVLPEQRLLVTEVLLRRQAQNNAAIACARVVWDKDANVRRGAAALIRAHADPRAAVRSLASGLLHDVPAMRIRTAEAFAELGAKEGAALLALAGPAAGIPRRADGTFGHRGHIASTTSRSYIRDFDVEIAQAAAVANPIIGTAKSGVVLDVNVPAVVTQRVRIENAYAKALQRLVGSAPGRDPRTWASWLGSRDPAAARLIAR